MSGVMMRRRVVGGKPQPGNPGGPGGPTLLPTWSDAWYFGTYWADSQVTKQRNIETWRGTPFGHVNLFGDSNTLDGLGGWAGEFDKVRTFLVDGNTEFIEVGTPMLPNEYKSDGTPLAPTENMKTLADQFRVSDAAWVATPRWVTSATSVASRAWLTTPGGITGDRMIYRIGWEMNGNWMRHSVMSNKSNGNPSFGGGTKAEVLAGMRDHRDSFRQIAKSIRTKAPGAKFAWVPNNGAFRQYNQSDIPDVTTPGAGTLFTLQEVMDNLYPGDEYVDYIGLNAYWKDTSIAVIEQYMRQWATVALEHGKQFAMPEYGYRPGVDGADLFALAFRLFSEYATTRLPDGRPLMGYAGLWQNETGYRIRTEDGGNKPLALAEYLNHTWPPNPYGRAAEGATFPSGTFPAGTFV